MIDIEEDHHEEDRVTKKMDTTIKESRDTKKNATTIDQLAEARGMKKTCTTERPGEVRDTMTSPTIDREEEGQQAKTITIDRLEEAQLMKMIGMTTDHEGGVQCMKKTHIMTELPNAVQR
jgi:hypothetical protein